MSLVSPDKLLYPKQFEAFTQLLSGVYKEVVYGGSAGPGKSFLGCFWAWFMCTTFPGIRIAIARNNLKDTRESVVISMGKLCQIFSLGGIRNSENGFKFNNGSEAVFVDLTFYPRKDPLYERYGSKEFTIMWGEEMGEAHPMSYEILSTRVGRHLNDKYKIPAVKLITCNPKKNWLYKNYYQPFKNGTLPDNVKFIQAYASDNPGLTQDYLDTLDNIRDKAQRKRLRDGDWEYDSSPNSLCNSDALSAIFSNHHCGSHGESYITADIARMGSDKAIIAAWKGHTIVEFVIFEKSRLTEIQAAIISLQSKYGVQYYRAIADEDGVGGGVVDNTGIKGFMNNSKALNDENYYNLKSQCGYHIAQTINQGKFWIKAELSEAHKQEILDELECLQSFELDKDGKLRTLPKAKIKEKIGRSPDWLDTILMRSWFDIKAGAGYELYHSFTV